MWPLGATKTALVEPIVLPSGNWNQCSTVRYGLGWEFGCARTWGTAKNAAALPISARTIWPEFGMTARLYSSV